MGTGDVPPSTPRVFVCAVNSSLDLEYSLHLRDSLRRMLPETSFKLLLFIDMQKKPGAMRVEGLEGSDILFYAIDTNTNVTQHGLKVTG